MELRASAGPSTSNSRLRKRLTWRRHVDQQVRESERRQRRVGGLAVGIPLAPQRRVGRFNLLAKPLVKGSETLGIVKIVETVATDAEIHR
jgi:hypothetical protein